MTVINEHTIFARSEAGQREAYNPQSKLPRVLRTLLFSIDGRSTAGQYATLLPNFGDVFGHLEALHRAGYLRIRRGRTSRSRRAESASGASGFEVTSQPPAQTQDSRWRVSQLKPASPEKVMSHPPRGVRGLLRSVLGLNGGREARPDKWGPSQQFATSVLVDESPTQNVLRETLGPEGEQVRLQATRQLMISFLHLYLPAIAREASMTIEDLRTHDQLISSLPDYSRLALRAGAAGSAHLVQVRHALGLAR